MPAVSSNATVLVTGASGFAAAHIVDQLLKQGHAVIGTVRSPPKGDYLKDLFKEHGDRFSYVIVEDMGKPGAFDQAVQNVDAIEHVASPFHLSAKDPQEIIKPAVDGTLTILESALKFGPKVKRIVLTSSTSSIAEQNAPPYAVYNESHWNNFAVDVVQKQGAEADGFLKYEASKTLAERAAWDWMKEKKPSFDLVCINPSLIYGPPINQAKSIQDLGTSLGYFCLSLSKPSKEGAFRYFHNQVYVVDVGIAHAKALLLEEAGGNRYIVSQSPLCVNDWYKILNEAGVANVPKPYPDDEKDEGKFSYHDGSKATKELGFQYTPLKDMLVNTTEALRKRFPGTI